MFIDSLFITIYRTHKQSAYLTKVGKASKINRPDREKKHKNMKGNKPTKNNGSINKINAGNNSSHPNSIEDSKWPNIQTPSPMLLPQQVNFVHHLPSHMETRHLNAFPISLNFALKLQSDPITSKDICIK